MSGIRGVANAPQTGLQHEKVHVTWAISTKSLAFARDAINIATAVVAVKNPAYWLGGFIGVRLREALDPPPGLMSAEINDKTSLIKEIIIRERLVCSLVSSAIGLGLVCAESTLNSRRGSFFSLDGLVFGSLIGFGFWNAVKNQFMFSSSVEPRTATNVEESIISDDGEAIVFKVSQ